MPGIRFALVAAAKGTKVNGDTIDGRWVVIAASGIVPSRGDGIASNMGTAGAASATGA